MDNRPTHHLNLAVKLALGLLSILMPRADAFATTACTCAGIDPLDALAYSDNVFVGTVISREEPPPRYVLYKGDSVQVISGGDMIRWRLQTTRGWKGKPLTVVEIYSERDGAACGFTFQIGETYFVYAHSMESDWARGRDWPERTKFPVLSTNLCIGTKSVDRAGYDLARLGAPIWLMDQPPAVLVLRQNRPNPFNPDTQIEFDLPHDYHVDLRVFDTVGRLVRSVFTGDMPAGSQVLSWDGRDDRGASVGSGVYFYEVRAGTLVSRRQMILVR